MIYGLYLSAAGVQMSSHRQDVISNNLANAETVDQLVKSGHADAAMRRVVATNTLVLVGPQRDGPPRGERLRGPSCAGSDRARR